MRRAPAAGRDRRLSGGRDDPLPGDSNPDTPLDNKLVEWGLEVFKRSWANIGMGLELQRAFVEVGLPSPQAAGVPVEEIDPAEWTGTVK